MSAIPYQMFQCRCSDSGSPDWIEIQARDAQEAAETYVRRYNAAALEFPLCREVDVSDGPGGYQTFDVHLIATPEYEARIKK